MVVPVVAVVVVVVVVFTANAASLGTTNANETNRDFYLRVCRLS